MLAVTGAMKGAGRCLACAHIADGRFSGGTHGFCVGHVAPEAVDGGPIAFVEVSTFITSEVEGSSKTTQKLETPKTKIHKWIPSKICEAGSRC